MRLSLLCLFLLGLCPALAVAAPDPALFGRWQGNWSDGSGAVQINLSSRDPFQAAIQDGSTTLATTRFTSGSRSGIYEGEVPGGLMSWLALGDGPDPLEGRPLIWARDGDGGTLVIYHFQLDETGSFGLVKYALAIGTDGMTIIRSTVQPSGGVVQNRAQLERLP